MAFAVTHTYDGSAVIAAKDLDRNFTDVETKLNGNLVSENFAHNAAITNGQLSNKKYEIVLTCTIHGITDNAAGLNTNTTGQFLVGSLPYEATGGAADYTIESIDHILFLGTGSPTTTMICSLVHGYFDVVPVWQTVDTIKTGITVPLTNGQTHYDSGDLTTSSITVDATRPNFLVLKVTTKGIGYDDGDSWCISVKLTRDNGLRG